MKVANLISVVRENVDYLVYIWFEQIKDSAHFKKLNVLTNSKLINKGEIIFEELVLWLEQENNLERIEKLGYSYYTENFSLDEAIESVFIAKSISINFLLVDNPITNRESSIETISILNEYFDQFIFHLTNGFTTGIYNKLKEDEKYSDDELLQLFHLSSIDASSNFLINDIFSKGFNSGILK
ncbi:MAG: hypothetical protein JEY94_11725 [Melioribacteraceae bacterium]|nr:hypothetical protein [Melioribacteraceae bacterium]